MQVMTINCATQGALFHEILKAATARNIDIMVIQNVAQPIDSPHLLSRPNWLKEPRDGRTAIRRANPAFTTIQETPHAWLMIWAETFRDSKAEYGTVILRRKPLTHCWKRQFGLDMLVVGQGSEISVAVAHIKCKRQQHLTAVKAVTDYLKGQRTKLLLIVNADVAAHFAADGWLVCEQLAQQVSPTTPGWQVLIDYPADVFSIERWHSRVDGQSEFAVVELH
jgi:hypothetical protein